MKKQHLLLLAAIAFTFSGCLGPAMINKWVSNHYNESYNTPAKIKADYLTITSNLVTADLKASTTKKQVKNFLPLVFYWQYDYMNTCTLNPKIPVNTFRSTVQSYANSKGLKQKLNGRKIEISIDQIPNVFVLNDRGHIIWVVYVFGWDVLTFRPQNAELVVSYKITNENGAVQNGIVTVPNSDKILHLRFLQSLKKATGQYLDQYNESIKAMSKVAVDKILTDVAGQNTALVQ
jgi:hypothetical protein